jgi:hypothetical protein
MHQYELKLFGPRMGSAPLRPTLASFLFEAPHNLAAIEHAKGAFAEAISGSDYARLLQEGAGMIWEEYASGG